MAGDNKLTLTRRPVDPNWPKIEPGRPMSLHTFPENFMQIGPAVFS